MAATAAAVRSLTWSFSKMLATCVFTVPAEIPSRPAISLLRRPAESSRRTSSSRALSGRRNVLGDEAAALCAPASAIELADANTRSVMRGSRTHPPARTSLTAWRNAAADVSSSRALLAPRSIARIRLSTPSQWPNAITRAFGQGSRIMRSAAVASSSLAAPLQARPTITTSGDAPTQVSITSWSGSARLLIR